MGIFWVPITSLSNDTQDTFHSNPPPQTNKHYKQQCPALPKVSRNSSPSLASPRPLKCVLVVFFRLVYRLNFWQQVCTDTAPEVVQEHIRPQEHVETAEAVDRERHVHHLQVCLFFPIPTIMTHGLHINSSTESNPLRTTKPSTPSMSTPPSL